MGLAGFQRQREAYEGLTEIVEADRLKVEEGLPAGDPINNTPEIPSDQGRNEEPEAPLEQIPGQDPIKENPEEPSKQGRDESESEGDGETGELADQGEDPIKLTEEEPSKQGRDETPAKDLKEQESSNDPLSETPIQTTKTSTRKKA